MKRAARLPSGKYVQRGRAVPFSKLSKTQQGLWRSFWSTKAARTKVKREAEVRASIVVAEAAHLSGEMKRRGLRVFAVNDPDQEYTAAQIVKQLGETAREKVPKMNRATFVAVVEWPDDPRSTPGRPYTTRISRAARDVTTAGELHEAERRAAGFFGAVQDDPAGRLSGPAEQHPSRGRGRAVIKSTAIMVWHAPLKRKRRKLTS